nr:CHAT domain-containing protein [uncultured Duganella sp.]
MSPLQSQPAQVTGAGAASYFGRLNELYFNLDGGRIASVADRARRTRPIEFVERLLTDAPDNEQLSLRSSSVSGLLDEADGGRRKQVVRAGRQYQVLGDSLQYMALASRSLHYDTLERDAVCTRALLTISVPVGCVLEVASPLFDSPAVGQVPAPLSVEVHGTGAWSLRDGKLQFDCRHVAGEIAFLFESRGTPHPLASEAIVCIPGREREAVIARAALGADFVPALVLSHPSLWAGFLNRQAFVRALILTSTHVDEDNDAVLVFRETIRHSAPIREALGLSRRRRVVVAPENDELLGPALAIAVACDADLQVEADMSVVILREDGGVLATWGEGELLGKVMPDLHDLASVALPIGDELVLCEAALDELLVVQAVGYAASHRLPLAFLRPPQFKSGPSTPSYETYRLQAEQLVPPELRAPAQSALTVFTRGAPLHLVRVHQTALWPQGHWATTHVVSHLPGQSASVLIPRWFSDELDRVPTAPISVFFNGLGSHGATDHVGLGSTADRLLNHLLAIEDKAAKSEVLRQVLERLSTALVLIAAHGAERAIELEQGHSVRDSEIADWRLTGSPLVFNNSCSSWTEVGQAFLRAGARAYVGTLWDVTHESASNFANCLLQQMLDRPFDGVARALTLAAAHRAADATAAYDGAYIYVGLPQASARLAPPVNRFERLENAALAMHRLYGFLHELVDDGRMSIARLLQPGVHATVVAGFSGIQSSDDPVALPLPPPFAGTVLDLGFVVGTADVQLLRRVAQASPAEEQEGVLTQCIAALDNVISDLSTWAERHRAFEGARGNAPGFDAGAQVYRLLVLTAYEVVLPLAKDCSDLQMVAQTRRLFALASVMVTIPADLAAGTPPAPQTVLERIRQGIPQLAQVVGSGERAELDQLENAVNRSDLANRFGIVLRGLDDESSAIEFFELASELAKVGSRDQLNARANRWKRADPLAKLPQVLQEQLGAGDLGNAAISGSNLLRSAGAARQQLPSDLLGKIENLPDRISGVEARASVLCLLLGGFAVYYAGVGDFAEAQACSARIGDHLAARHFSDPGGLAHATTGARALFEHLHETGSYAAACDEGVEVVARLRQAELHEEALRVHIAICSSAIRGYEQRRQERFLTAFLENSALAGRLVQDWPNLAEVLPDMVDWVAQNSSSIWQQAAANGQLWLALLAYEAQRSWPDGVTDRAWELLRAARSESNRAAIANLAATGDLHRFVSVVIDDEFRVAAEVTTLRSATIGPPVISSWPLSSLPNDCSCGPESARIVARHVVGALTPDSRVIAREVSLPHLQGDSRGAYLYSDVWGSRTISYSLELRLPARLLPQRIRLQGVARDTVAIDMRFVPDGCEVRIAPRNKDVRWLGRLDIFCFDVKDTKFPFVAADGPFGNWVPVELFEQMMSLLGRSQTSSG